MSKRAKHIDLKNHFIPTFIEDINGVQQSDIYKMHADLSTVDIRTKDIDVKVFKHHATELDLGVPRLKEIFCGKNKILK